MRAITRRELLAASAAMAVLPLTAITSKPARAADEPRLDPNDAQAKALAYVHESPKPANNCANCRLYTGVAADEWGPCAIFPGKQVASAGWCSAWVGKS